MENLEERKIKIIIHFMFKTFLIHFLRKIFKKNSYKIAFFFFSFFLLQLLYMYKQMNTCNAC